MTDAELPGPALSGPVPADLAPAGPVPPGTGWPEDPAAPATPAATSAAAVRTLAGSADDLEELAARQSVCRACPRLVEWREQVAATRRRSTLSQQYWGRPVPGWGAQQPQVLIVGLAPAAHGGNRTGRIFTGDRSGDVLFASLWRTGFAVQPTSQAAGDGQRLVAARMAAAVRCAPPQNRPTVTERDTCAPWLAAEISLMLSGLRVVVCLGHFAWQAVWSQLAAAGLALPRPRPRFGHGAEGMAQPPGGEPLLVLGCYHPSQQNTFTGRVTPVMLDEVFSRARAQADR